MELQNPNEYGQEHDQGGRDVQDQAESPKPTTDEPSAYAPSAGSSAAANVSNMSSAVSTPLHASRGSPSTSSTSSAASSSTTSSTSSLRLSRKDSNSHEILTNTLNDLLTQRAKLLDMFNSKAFTQALQLFQSLASHTNDANLVSAVRFLLETLKREADYLKNRTTKVAFFGKMKVGKSTLATKLLGEQKSFFPAAATPQTSFISSCSSGVQQHSTLLFNDSVKAESDIELALHYAWSVSSMSNDTDHYQENLALFKRIWGKAIENQSSPLHSSPLSEEEERKLIGLPRWTSRSYLISKLVFTRPIWGIDTPGVEIMDCPGMEETKYLSCMAKAAAYGSEVVIYVIDHQTSMEAGTVAMDTLERMINAGLDVILVFNQKDAVINAEALQKCQNFWTNFAEANGLRDKFFFMRACYTIDPHESEQAFSQRREQWQLDMEHLVSALTGRLKFHIQKRFVSFLTLFHDFLASIRTVNDSFIARYNNLSNQSLGLHHKVRSVEKRASNSPNIVNSSECLKKNLAKLQTEMSKRVNQQLRAEWAISFDRILTSLKGELDDRNAPTAYCVPEHVMEYVIRQFEPLLAAGLQEFLTATGVAHMQWLEKEAAPLFDATLSRLVSPAPQLDPKAIQVLAPSAATPTVNVGIGAGVGATIGGGAFGASVLTGLIAASFVTGGISVAVGALVFGAGAMGLRRQVEQPFKNPNEVTANHLKDTFKGAEQTYWKAMSQIFDTLHDSYISAIRNRVMQIESLERESQVPNDEGLFVKPYFSAIAPRLNSPSIVNYFTVKRDLTSLLWLLVGYSEALMREFSFRSPLTEDKSLCVACSALLNSCPHLCAACNLTYGHETCPGCVRRTSLTVDNADSQMPGTFADVLNIPEINTLRVPGSILDHFLKDTPSFAKNLESKMMTVGKAQSMEVLRTELREQFGKIWQIVSLDSHVPLIPSMMARVFELFHSEVAEHTAIVQDTFRQVYSADDLAWHEASKLLSPELLNGLINPNEWLTSVVELAARTIATLPTLNTPLKKFCAYCEAVSLVQQASIKPDPGADSRWPVLAYIMLKHRPTTFVSDAHMIIACFSPEDREMSPRLAFLIGIMDPEAVQDFVDSTIKDAQVGPSSSSSSS